MSRLPFACQLSRPQLQSWSCTCRSRQSPRLQLSVSEGIPPRVLLVLELGPETWTRDLHGTHRHMASRSVLSLVVVIYFVEVRPSHVLLVESRWVGEYLVNRVAKISGRIGMVVARREAKVDGIESMSMGHRVTRESRDQISGRTNKKDGIGSRWVVWVPCKWCDRIIGRIGMAVS